MILCHLTVVGIFTFYVDFSESI